MRNMRILVKFCVPLIGGSISWPFHDIASRNLQQDELLISHGEKLQLCFTS